MSEHYFTNNPTSKIMTKSFTHTIKNKTLSFTSVSGVFSFEYKLDKASEILIKSFVPSGGKVLDIGCGYGAIGIFIKALFPEQNIVMTDVNNRALEYARKNALSNNVDVKIIESDLFNNNCIGIFDDIVSNPPFAAGKDVLKALVEGSFEHLVVGGNLWLVGHHNKGGSWLKSYMNDIFGNCIDVEKTGGIRVYRSTKLLQGAFSV